MSFSKLMCLTAITDSKYAPSGLTDCTQKESTSDDMPSVYVLAYIAIIYQPCWSLANRLRFVFQIHLHYTLIL